MNVAADGRPGDRGQDVAGLQRRYEEVQRQRDDLQRQLNAVFEAQPAAVTR